MSAAAKKTRPDSPPNFSEIEEILSQVSLFADIKNNVAAFKDLYSLMSVRVYKAGETIIREGGTGSDFFILADGTASVYKKTAEGDSYKVAILAGHMGTFFGESGLLEADTRTASIIAETECRCLALTKEDFDDFSQRHPEWALPVLKRVAKAIMNRLKNMNHDLSLLYKALLDEFSHR